MILFPSYYYYRASNITQIYWPSIQFETTWFGKIILLEYVFDNIQVKLTWQHLGIFIPILKMDKTLDGFLIIFLNHIPQAEIFAYIMLLNLHVLKSPENVFTRHQSLVNSHHKLKKTHR